MRALIQRVSSASVQIDNKVFSKIGNGLLVLLGVEDEDSDSDIDWLSSKISQMRIFDDKNDNMNLSVNDINGEVLVVSNLLFTRVLRKETGLHTFELPNQITPFRCMKHLFCR